MAEYKATTDLWIPGQEPTAEPFVKKGQTVDITREMLGMPDVTRWIMFGALEPVPAKPKPKGPRMTRKYKALTRLNTAGGMAKGGPGTGTGTIEPGDIIDLDHMPEGMNSINAGAWIDQGFLVPMDMPDPEHDIRPEDLTKALEKSPGLLRDFLEDASTRWVHLLPRRPQWVPQAGSEASTAWVMKNVMGQDVGLIRFDAGNHPGTPAWSCWVYDPGTEWRRLDLRWGAKQQEAEIEVLRAMKGLEYDHMPEDNEP